MSPHRGQRSRMPLEPRMVDFGRRGYPYVSPDLHETQALLVGGVGAVCLAIGLAAATYDAGVRYADGCGHGARVGLAAAAGLVAAGLVVGVRRVPPQRLAIGLLVAMVLFVGADS